MRLASPWAAPLWCRCFVPLSSRRWMRRQWSLSRCD